MRKLAFAGLFLILCLTLAGAVLRPRIREFGIIIGVLPPGPYNAITDVHGVKVGHVTLIRGKNIRTGVTAILPHGGNIYQEKVPAAIYTANGYGKLAGYTQVEELGNMETPIILTNTLNVAVAVKALIDYTLSLPGNERVSSVNAVVGETNDGWLNDIRGQHVHESDVLQAIHNARSGPVKEGSVGAGTGTICFGFKGGIGTSSRKLPESQGGFTVGVLVQTNHGGILRINGYPIGRDMRRRRKSAASPNKPGGSCMVVVATNAPLDSRNLKRLAKRALLGIARSGGYYSNGSGDYAVAFSTAPDGRIPNKASSRYLHSRVLINKAMSPLFLAAAEATEEAILDSLFKATSMTGRDGHRIRALPLDQLRFIKEKTTK